MTRSLESHPSAQTIEVASRLEFLQLDPDLFLFRRQVVATAAGEARPASLPLPREAFPSFCQQGVVDREGRAALLAGAKAKTLPVTVFTQEQLEAIRVDGFVATISAMNKKDGEKDIWTRFQEDDSLTVDNMITVDMSSHMLFDRHGEVLPAAVFFDYTSSGIDESSHDLLALAEHLLQRPDIRVYSGHRHRGEMEGRNIATSAKDAIFDIPHYNVQEGRTQSVQFAWIPFHDDYKRVWALCKGKYPSTQIRERFRELDIVGMRQFDLSQKKRPRP